jgi:hypothetical protein
MSVFKNTRDVLKKLEMSYVYSGDWFRIARESAWKDEMLARLITNSVTKKV